MPAILHPLWDLPLPGFADLIGRATDEGQDLLLHAARFTARRADEQRDLAAALHDLTAGPWLAPDLPLAPPPADELTPTDLLRAILAIRPDLVTDLMFGDPPDSLHDGEFGEACARWAALRHDLPPAPEALKISRWWARRLALFPRPIDAPACLQLIGEAGLRWLARCAERHVEGLVTEDEALHRALDVMALRGRPAYANPLGPGYVDHFDGLAALGDALVRSPGAVLLGERNVGRRALLTAFGRRLHVHGEPSALRSFGFNVDNFHGGPMLGTADDPDAFLPPAAVDRRMIYALTRDGFGAALGPEPDPTITRLLRHCADLCRDAHSEFRLVLAATPYEWSALLALVPDLAALEPIAVPPIPDDALLPAWLAHAPGIEDRCQRRINLLGLTHALFQRPEGALREFDRCDDIVAESHSDHVLRFERRRASLSHAELHRRIERRLGGVRTFIPTPDRLAELTAMERSILGPA